MVAIAKLIDWGGERVREKGGTVALKGRVGNEGGITTSARTSFELVGADRGLAGLCERRTAGAWPVDCRGVKSARFRAEEGGGAGLKFRKISRNWEGNSCDRSASINAGDPV